MTRISSNFVFIIICLQMVCLSACGQGAQKQAVKQSIPDEINVYEGYYYGGGNVSSFVPCESNEKPGRGKGYWLATNDQFDEMYQEESTRMMQAAIGTLGPGMDGGLYIKFKGIASPSLDTASGEGYGYLNQYRQQITVTEAIQMKYFIVPYDADLCKAK
ncbi:MAG: hypothetical protein HY865_20795 [Chloroflexi bacterium]|nr:hypothetical protein [Chloroflexota bacterium]